MQSIFHAAGIVTAFGAIMLCATTIAAVAAAIAIRAVFRVAYSLQALSRRYRQRRDYPRATVLHERLIAIRRDHLSAPRYDRGRLARR